MARVKGIRNRSSKHGELLRLIIVNVVVVYHVIIVSNWTWVVEEMKMI